jgi:hypothetical protein
VLGGYWLASLKKSAGVPTQKIVAENSAQQSRAAITRIEAKNRGLAEEVRNAMG